MIRAVRCSAWVGAHRASPARPRLVRVMLCDPSSLGFGLIPGLFHSETCGRCGEHQSRLRLTIGGSGGLVTSPFPRVAVGEGARQGCGLPYLTWNEPWLEAGAGKVHTST